MWQENASCTNMVIVGFRTGRANHPRIAFVAVLGINIKRREKEEETGCGNTAVIAILTDGDVVCLSLVLAPIFDWTSRASLSAAKGEKAKMRVGYTC